MKRVLDTPIDAPPQDKPYYEYKVVFRHMETAMEVGPHFECRVLLLLRHPLTEHDRDAYAANIASELKLAGTETHLISEKGWNLPITYIPKETGWRVVPNIAKGIDVDFEVLSKTEQLKANNMHAHFVLAGRPRFPSEQLQVHLGLLLVPIQLHLWIEWRIETMSEWDKDCVQEKQNA